MDSKRAVRRRPAPLTHYRSGDAKAGFNAEFLTPLFGPEHGKEGKPKATRRVAGVISQQLRHLEILPLSPWTISLTRSMGSHSKVPHRYELPILRAFFLTKL